MNDREAIAAAKKYINEIYADEHISNLGLEEFEYGSGGGWMVTISFSRPWTTPKTRAQEVLESLGAVQSLQRSFKVVRLADDGTVLSMKTLAPHEAAK